MPGCQRIPQRRHVELVANSETGSMGLTKARVCMPYRGLCACHEVCPVRDCSAPLVPRQEEFSGAATARTTVRVCDFVVVQYCSLSSEHLCTFGHLMVTYFSSILVS